MNKALQSKTSPKSPTKSPRKRQQQHYLTVAPTKRPKVLLVEEKVEKKGSTIGRTWVDKYRPTSLNQLVGQQTDKSCANKLLFWLKQWAKNHLSAPAPGEKKKARPSPFQAQVDGSTFKAALLSGPPGIGKTTCAVLCCKELGLDYVEMNASDVRNKAAILKRSEQLTSHQMEKYCRTAGEVDENSMKNGVHNGTMKKSPSKQFAKMNCSKFGIEHVLIMDEVDGMSGNADRAGIAELILMIKRTRVPIICICNDRQSRKIRSLANYCFDLRFQRPRVEQIKGKLMSILAKERATLPREALDKVIEASNQDIRQAINTLQFIATSGLPKHLQKKDITVNIFEASRQILSADTSFMQKLELYFSDYSLMPLFVQENYPNVRSSQSGNLEHLHAISQAADSIAFGDVVDKQVRAYGNWNLLQEHAMFSSVLPSSRMDGYLNAQIQFPSWFGKHSNAQKRQRLMRQLSLHTHLKITGSSHALVQDYLSLLRDRLYRPLVEKDSAGVSEVLHVYNNYCLLREDAEAINELGVWPLSAKRQQKDLAAMVSTKAKSALTRQLNKEKRMLPFARGVAAITKMGGRKKGTKGGEMMLEARQVPEEGEDEENNNISDGEEEEEAATLVNLDF